MNKYCKEALSLPQRYEIIKDDEMIYYYGGSVSLKMKQSYLNKNTCLNKAASLIRNGSVTGMSKQAIAEEIFAHAQIFLRAAVANFVGIDMGIINEIASHAAVIDIEDGGDVWYRRIAYTALWYGNPSM